LLLTLGFLAIGAGLICTSKNLTGHQAESPIFKRYDHDTAELYSQIGGGISLAFGVIFLLITFCCKNNIDTAMGCIEAACQCMFGEMELLLQPVIDVVIRLSLFFALAFGFLIMCSMGEVKADNEATIGGHQVAGASRSIQYTDEEKYMLLYYIFGYFWIMELANALCQFVISYVVVLWYYTEKNENGGKKLVFGGLLRGYAAGMVHLGSLAFGAFLIATCRMVNLILGFVAKQAKAGGNPVMALIAKALMCCVTCFQRFLEYINKNAYIDIAINSNTFCTAALHSFEFLAKEGAIIALLSGACSIFVVAGVMLISGTTGYFAYMFVINDPMTDGFMDETSELYVANPEFVGGVGGLLGFVISLCFMMLFDQTADTLLYCFAWNKKEDPAGVHFYAPDTLSALVPK